jgi:hypothetical protein
MTRRLLPVVVLLSCAALAVLVLYGRFTIEASRRCRDGDPGRMLRVPPEAACP